ncbi:MULTISPECIES: hypothetical protein [unclassified Corynebacterium]
MNDNAPLADMIPFDMERIMPAKRGVNTDPLAADSCGGECDLQHVGVY